MIREEIDVTPFMATRRQFIYADDPACRVHEGELMEVTTFGSIATREAVGERMTITGLIAEPKP